MKKKLKVAIVVTVSLIILAFLSNILMNRVFYNPYRDYDSNSKVFYLSVQTLMPNYSNAYISRYEPGTPKSFSRFSQGVIINQLSAKHDINRNIKIKGKMNYLFGSATYEKNTMHSSKNVFTQSHFSSEREIEEIAIKDDSYYMAHIAFRNPLPTEEIIQSLSPKFEGNAGDLVRIIVRTSEDVNAVALGMDYQSSFFLFGQGGYARNVSPNQTELIFKNNLRFLKEYDETLQMYLRSGLFGEVELNIEERIRYLSVHGIKNMGVVLFGKGEALQGILHNPDFFLTYLEEDI